MKPLILLVLLTLSAKAGELECISMVETGDDDKATGAHGERSRWAMLPSVYRAHHLTPLDCQNHALARAASQDELELRTVRFAKKTHRKPTEFEAALLWHCPARLNHPTKNDRDYAQRVCNLMSAERLRSQMKVVAKRAEISPKLRASSR